MELPVIDPKRLQLIRTAADGAARAIPPAWSLEATVAVNPFLGQTGDNLATTAARLGRIAGQSVTMPRDWYTQQITKGEITEADLTAAYDATPTDARPTSFEVFKAGIDAHDDQAHDALPTVADLARDASGFDWPRFLTDRIGTWASSYFDQGQALWGIRQGQGAYTAWRAMALHDLTPEILGLRGLRPLSPRPRMIHPPLSCALLNGWA
jgi:Uncharacterized protein conserved in bacteria